MDPRTPLITVAICTYNRARYLPSAIESLVGQSLAASQFEILVVDNASTDATRAVVEPFLQKLTNLRYVYEARQGLSNARNTAWQSAAGKYVAYLDDDAQADPKWLLGLLRHFEQSTPTPWSVGGVILPWYDSPKPAWFKEQYESAVLDNHARLLRPGESLNGSNMAFPRAILERFGGFNPAAGVNGNRLLLGEETQFHQQLWASGEEPVMHFDPALVVRHLVPAQKMRPGYYLKRRFAVGQTDVLAQRPLSLKRRLGITYWALRGGLRSAIIAIGGYRLAATKENWLIEQIGPVVHQLGRLGEALALSLRVRQYAAPITGAAPVTIGPLATIEPSRPRAAA